MVKMKRKEDLWIKVNVDMYYVVPKTEYMNGWDADDIMEEWFLNFNVNQSHASRDGYKIGGAIKTNTIKKISRAQYELDQKERTTQLEEREKHNKDIQYKTFYELMKSIDNKLTDKHIKQMWKRIKKLGDNWKE